jgi:succinate dehydrogenase/fumarate reductase flavoprotein subunit
VIDPEGSITGLRMAQAPGGSTLTARGGVVLACGGFEADPALADAYLPLGPSWPVGHPGNTGAFRCAEYESPFAIDFSGASHLFTDADGRRFADETGYEVHDRLRALLAYLPRNPNRPGLPSWAVFDEAARQAGPLNGLLGTPNDYTWSADNSAEIDRGWVQSAGGAAELAGKMGVAPAILEDTLAEYNMFARAGRDDRFGRSADTLIPLDTSRLYAIETWPGIAGTTGGPRHDERARVLRPDGQPVPGLYAAGAVSLVWGHLIEHGGGLTDAIVFGRCAGTQAAARAGQRA